MKHFILLFTILLYLGIVSYCCTLTFDNAERIEEQQNEIEHLNQQIIKNELLIKLLINKEAKENENETF